ncbi:MAG: hypothetical protein MOIL_01571 [Candidatus Methanolliviera sp. GoM_oil]|nr:MAG: hypothetical protein MOIL_01571 [Candidatus Methanolliviera sp. GoM_oil]
MAEIKEKDKDHVSDKPDTEKPFNIEERMGRVEGALGQMGKRLDNVETAISGLRGEIGDLRKHVDTGLSGLRGEIGDLRKEMTANIGELRKEMTANIGELRSHVDTGLSGMRGEMGGLRGEMDERFRSTNRIMITMWVTIIIAILSGILTMVFKM